MANRPALLAILTLSLTIYLVGCQPTKPAGFAPLNSQDVLQKLANAYKKQAEPLPMNPLTLTPTQRKKFVKIVFSEAGYDYTSTLIHLAEIDPSSVNQLHKDMRDLLFLPHYGVNFQEVKSIYTEQERTAIDKIKKLMQ